MRSKLPRLVLAFFIMVNVSACSVIDNFTDVKRSNLNYKNNASTKALDFPPDLTAPEFDNAFALPANGVVSASSSANNSRAFYGDNARVNVLPKSTNVRFGQQGTLRWLDVNESADTLWSKLRAFWRTVGIAIKKDEPRIGIMETEWAESSAGLPAGFLRNALGKVFQSGFDAGARDRYRIRVEKSTSKMTRIFLTHKGAEEVVDGVGSGWQLRPANHEYEAEMLNRLRAYLQGDIAAVTGKSALTVKNSALQTSSVASIVEQEGRTILQIHDTYKRTWVLTGIMMDRMGLVVEKQNQASGIYHVTYQGNDEDAERRGFFKKFFGDRTTILTKEQDYQVHIQDAGKLSVVRIFDEEGKPLGKRQTKLALARIKKEFDR